MNSFSTNSNLPATGDGFSHITLFKFKDYYTIYFSTIWPCNSEFPVTSAKFLFPPNICYNSKSTPYCFGR